MASTFPDQRTSPSSDSPPPLHQQHQWAWKSFERRRHDLARDEKEYRQSARKEAESYAAAKHWEQYAKAMEVERDELLLKVKGLEGEKIQEKNMEQRVIQGLKESFDLERKILLERIAVLEQKGEEMEEEIKRLGKLPEIWPKQEQDLDAVESREQHHLEARLPSVISIGSSEAEFNPVPVPAQVDSPVSSPILASTSSLPNPFCSASEPLSTANVRLARGKKRDRSDVMDDGFLSDFGQRMSSNVSDNGTTEYVGKSQHGQTGKTPRKRTSRGRRSPKKRRIASRKGKERAMSMKDSVSSGGDNRSGEGSSESGSEYQGEGPSTRYESGQHSADGSQTTKANAIPSLPGREKGVKKFDAMFNHFAYPGVRTDVPDLHCAAKEGMNIEKFLKEKGKGWRASKKLRLRVSKALLDE